MPPSISRNLRGLLERIPRPSALQDAALGAGDDDEDAGASTSPLVVVDHHRPEDEPGAVPDALRVMTGWAWRLIVLGAFVYFLFHALGALSEVVIPLIVSLLLTAVFWPLRDWLVRHRVAHGLSALICMLVLAVVVVGILALVTFQIASQWSDLSAEGINSFNRLVTWLETGRFHVSNEQIDSWLHQVQQKVSDSRSQIAGYAATFGSQLSHFFTGMLLALFSLFYFLYDGRKLANTAASLVPRRSRGRLMDSATRGWIALVAYVRAAVIIAACDGAGALLGAYFVGSAMWLAIGALTFLCAFVPLIGAIFSGAVATSVVFVTLGPVRAIIMLAVFIAVLELEGHVMQPFLLGKAVSIHPLIVLFGIAVGMVLGGPVGALFIVPLMAFANAFIRGWNRPQRRTGPGASRASRWMAGDGDDEAAAARGAEAVAQDVARVNAEATPPGEPGPETGMEDIARADAEASAVDHASGHGDADRDDPDLGND